MHTISVEELENLDPSNITILDIRSEEDFRRGSFPGAINIPMKKNLDEDSAEEGFFEPGSIETLEKDLPANKPVYILCHTGEQSKEAVKILNEDGYNASNIDGGYRSWLRLSLERMVSEASVTERTKKIPQIHLAAFHQSHPGLPADPGRRPDRRLYLRRQRFHASRQAHAGDPEAWPCFL